jgi:hypothetical protein
VLVTDLKSKLNKLFSENWNIPRNEIRQMARAGQNPKHLRTRPGCGTG